MFGPLLKVQMCFRLASARDLLKVSKTWRFCSISKNDGRHGTFEEDLQRCIFRGRRSTRDMFIRDVRRSGRWFPARGCILEHQIFRFAKMILRDRCSTSYDLASLFVAHFTLHTSHSTLHTSHRTLHTPNFTLHTPHFTLHTSHVTLHSSHSKLHTSHFTVHTSHFTVHTSHFSLLTALFTLHISSHLSPSHLIPAHLFSSHLFSYVSKLSWITSQYYY